MVNSKYKLPLKFSPYSNHSLSWSINDEITHGEHDLEGLRKIVLEGRVSELRRYSEVLYHKNMREKNIFDTLVSSMNERAGMGLDSISEMVDEFRDWGFYYDPINERVNVNYKKAEKEV